MSDTREWDWRVGILHGLGECMWEQKGSVIRRISRLIVTAAGQVGMCKSIIGGVFVGLEEIDCTGLVVYSAGATDEQQKNAAALWSNIIPANGSRFRLDK